MRGTCGHFFTGSTEEDVVAERQILDVEEIDDVTHVTFKIKKVLDGSVIKPFGEELFALVDTEDRPKIVLDFSNVQYYAADALGKLIKFDEKMKAAGRKLRLCSIREDILEVFKITRLDKLFTIKENSEQALEDWVPMAQS